MDTAFLDIVRMTQQYSLNLFQPHRASMFTVSTADEQSIAMELIEVTDKTPKGFSGEQFSLVFRGPADPALEQRIYPMHHTVLGDLLLFLVPIEANSSGRLYEAFFNRTNDDGFNRN